MDTFTVLVFGWYDRGNCGDELMKAAMKAAFEPQGLTLRFVDRIDDLNGVSGVIFGGGSILLDAPDVTPQAYAILLSGSVPVFYVGVGLETDVHPRHQALLSVARKIVTRSQERPDGWTHETVVSYDIVYSLASQMQKVPAIAKRNSVLVVPNIELIPTYDRPHWMHIGWERFKDEMAQVLDELIVREDVMPEFMLMCLNPHQDDAWAMNEIVARMTKRSTQFRVHRVSAADDIVSLMCQFRAVITQRFHGIVLAEIAGVPYVSLCHHDKLRYAHPHRGESLEFHGATKKQVLSAVQRSLAAELQPYVPNMDTFNEAVLCIASIVKSRAAK